MLKIGTRFKIAAVVLGIVTCVLALSWWGMKSDDMEKANTETSTIPHVTDTERFIQYVRDTLEESGPELMQALLKELYADTTVGEQHMALHYFGEVLYEERGARALPLCEEWFGFGCYHGFLLDAIDTEGYDIVSFLDESCQQLSDTRETETCQHGIGHGLLEFSGRDPRKAVEACDLVADVFPKLGCASGVFMEYFAPTQSDKQSRVTLAPVYDEQNPFDVCTEFTGVRFATCVYEIQAWWQDVAKLPPREVEALCNSVQDQEAREFCLIGYGNFKGPEVSKALPYCDEFIVDESHALCRAGILFAAEHSPSSEDPLRACNDLGDKYSSLCLQKGRFMCELDANCGL